MKISSKLKVVAMKNLFIILACFCINVQAQQNSKSATGVPMGNVMPGPNSVYGFIVTDDNKNTFNMYLPSVKQYDVYKDERGNGNFKKIITLTFPSSYAEFAKRIGEIAAEEIKNTFGAKTDEEAYRQLVAGDPKKIGFLFLSKYFLQAIGVVWQDNDIKNNQANTTYKVVRVNTNEKEQDLFVQKVGNVSRIPFSKYELQSMLSTDSAVQVTWSSKSLNTPAFYGKIYRRESNEKTFKVLPKETFIYNVGDSSKSFYAENATPGKLYQYYLIPEDFAGNQGIPSDTAFAITKSFSQIKGIRDFKIKDSLKGAWLSWKSLPNEGVYTGIQILKSRRSTSGFVEVATISATDSTYYDTAILPNVDYHYQIRPLTIGAKGYGLMPSATASIAVKNQNEVPLAPQGLKVWQDSTAQVKLYWDVNPEIDQFAYYVLRGTSKDNMRIISSALRTNIFTDSLQNLDGQSTYSYGVQLMNISQKMSDLSNIAIFKPLKVEFVPYPSGISARYADEGVKLYWENMIEKHDDIVGYRIYRKLKNEKEFKSLNDKPIHTIFYDDTTVEPGLNYEYAIAAVNVSASQSILSPFTSITIPLTGVLAPPADFYLINKAEGIYVSWPPHTDLKATNSIYRKSTTEKEFKLIADIVNADSYVDSSAQKGVLYSYRIVAKSKIGTSNPSIEKSIRRN